MLSAPFREWSAMLKLTALAGRSKKNYEGE
jgi:hypothetical protein